ncbi:MAG: hypothetical protein IJC80_02615 [Clostridia bacterium]|nr:hypothetical protein [Clostridia bacterium]
MKYVSPIYDVELIATEDIMDVSAMADRMGISFSGDMATIKQNVTIDLTDDEGSSNGISQDPTNTTATGVSISMNFGGLFGNN